MLQILSALFGFAAPFLPELVKYFQRKQDMAHELEMMKLRMEASAQEHTWRLEEISATADIEEMKTLRLPQQSFGVQLLDAADKYVSTKWGQWLTTPVFYMFAVLDFAAGMVRPAITYAAFGFYIAYKYAMWRMAVNMGVDSNMVITQLWTENDWGVLVLVLSYYFGARTAKASFGGSANTSKKDG